MKFTESGQGETLHHSQDRLDKKTLLQYNQNIQNRMKLWDIFEEIEMAKKDKNADGCKVESIITVDERGQMVLPKELRERAKINAGDKLALASWEKNGEVCCITLIRVEDLVGMVKDRLGPVMKEIL